MSPLAHEAHVCVIFKKISLGTLNIRYNFSHLNQLHIAVMLATLHPSQHTIVHSGEHTCHIGRDPVDLQVWREQFQVLANPYFSHNRKTWYLPHFLSVVAWAVKITDKSFLAYRQFCKAADLDALLVRGIAPFREWSFGRHLVNSSPSAVQMSWRGSIDRFNP